LTPRHLELSPRSSCSQCPCREVAQATRVLGIGQPPTDISRMALKNFCPQVHVIYNNMSPFLGRERSGPCGAFLQSGKINDAGAVPPTLEMDERNPVRDPVSCMRGCHVCKRVIQICCSGRHIGYRSRRSVGILQLSRAQILLTPETPGG